MSLVGFHRFLIACGILFCAGYAVWEVRSFVETGSYGALALVISFATLALILVVYLWQLNRWLGYDDDDERRGSGGRSGRDERDVSG